jgi:hypothetical protein
MCRLSEKYAPKTLGGVLICQTCDSRRIERRPGPVVGEIVRRETAALLRLV